MRFGYLDECEGVATSGSSTSVESEGDSDEGGMMLVCKRCSGKNLIGGELDSYFGWYCHDCDKFVEVITMSEEQYRHFLAEHRTGLEE